MAVLVAAVVVPGSTSFVAIELPAAAADGEETVLFRLREATAPSLSPQRWVADLEVAQSSDTDDFLRRAWLYCSAAVFCVCVLIAIYWSRRARSWPQAEVAGECVLISADVGPAVVGFVRPRIVLPSWLLDAPPATLDAVLAHEREHLKAHDPQLLLASIVFICAMPWNLPLWWVVARLRRAIEVDCDARVLRDGRDPVAYGTLLLDINQQRDQPAARRSGAHGRRSDRAPIVSRNAHPSDARGAQSALALGGSRFCLRVCGPRRARDADQPASAGRASGRGRRCDLRSFWPATTTSVGSW